MTRAQPDGASVLAMMTFRTRLLYLISEPAEENEAEPHYPAGQLQQIGHIITTWTDYSFILTNVRHRKQGTLEMGTPFHTSNEGPFRTCTRFEC